jgi:outer membrane lipoprotein
MKGRVQYFLSMCLLLFVAGCVSNLPREITSAPVPDISLTNTQKDIKSKQGKLVRWGGIIINIENLPKKSILEILAKPLNNYGQPAINVTSPGRFFAEIDGFVDPSVYAAGRELTLFGTVVELRTSKIGNHEYHYPVISVSKYHLWAATTPYRNYDPYWDDDYYWGYHGPWLWYPWDHHYYPHSRHRYW